MIYGCSVPGSGGDAEGKFEMEVVKLPRVEHFKGEKVLNETDMRLNVENDTCASVDHQAAY